ncbi:hypothetical protein HYU17_05585 [Candidatus Woesearchaeota archaeon]|nr:hypothetical protein [Candidatus Woesearchaeota archaeon]
MSLSFKLGITRRTSKTGYNPEFFGVQAGVENVVADKIKGMQFGVLNEAKDITGVQAGVTNFAQYMQGVQAGAVNRGTENSIGRRVLQAGIVNNIESCLGVQLGISNAACVVRGIQAGLFNGLLYLNGIQAGAINRALNANGIQIGGYNSVASLNQPTLKSPYWSFPDGAKCVQVGLICRAEKTGAIPLTQLGLLTVRGNLPWYKGGITPFVGWHRARAYGAGSR